MAITTITNAMVSVNAIQGTLIADNAITAVHIATNAVSGTLIADNAVTATHIAQNTITVTQLADDAVEADKIADGVITTNHLNKAMISSQTEVTAVAGDFLLIGDTSDSNNLKKIPISGITSLVSSFDADAAQTFNDSGAAVDFRIDGDTEQNLFFVDGSADKIGIGLASPVTKLNVQGASASTYTGAGPGDILRVSQSTAGAWIASDFDGAFAYMGNDNSTTAKVAAYNYATSAEMNMILGQDRMYIKSDGNVGIGTTSPNDKLHIKIGTNLNWQFGYPNSSVTTLAALNDAESAYVDARVDALGLDLNTQSGGDITTGTGTTRQHYATDNGSNKRYTAPLNPKIAQVGLQGYWDPTKATDGTDFSPSSHGNGNQDLTLGSGVTHVTNSNRAVWQFDGTSNASMHGNPNLSAGKSASFSLWIYWNNVNSLSSSYQLNGIQIGNHYMYIGILQGANDSAPLYGYAGQGTNIPPSSANNYEQAYVNSDEWVYLTLQFGHGSSDVTGRTKGRAEAYLNGSLVQRRDNIALPTVAANGSSSFYLGRVQGGYYLDGYIGPAVLYERTLHQWEILENMRVHADMYMS